MQISCQRFIPFAMLLTLDKVQIHLTSVLAKPQHCTTEKV